MHRYRLLTKSTSASVISVCLKKKDPEHDNEQNNQNRIRLFDGALIKCFKKQITDMRSLDPEDHFLISHSYKVHHDCGESQVFLEHVRNIESVKMCELVMDIVKTQEYKHLHDKNESEVVNCIMREVQDLELRDWVFTQFDRGFFYDLKKIVTSAISPIIREKMGVIWIVLVGLFGLVSFYLDVFKDIVFYFTIEHVLKEFWVCFVFFCADSEKPLIKSYIII